MLVLSLALVGLSQLYVASMATYTKARYLSVATQRAQYELEHVKNLGFYKLSNAFADGSTAFLRTSAGGQYTWAANQTGPTYIVNFTVPDLPGGTGTITWAYWKPITESGSNLYRVEITVTWNGPQAAKSDVHLYTLVANI
jgi:hypothetical protein